MAASAEHSGTPDTPGQDEQLGPASSRSGTHPRKDPPVDRPDPEDPPVGPAEKLDHDFDPAAGPSNPDLVGSDTDEST
ncbi:hypothetical protein E3O44_06145 [Cryobacterium algoricola]|uniref:Uncharacterized protein n=1 Tax=Cryobacterium algoricola TaxID=1259183 RepID=A0ABY2IEZ2_9MICO|nr:hypothetical protein [Cryobacterium algoricola]TFB88250.1 hypothetical protein E3O44_06145 [Cryobacterium algoricola]